jgi:endonuclease/exonuclease/phosphatase family metal-dependent hydrolase
MQYFKFVRFVFLVFSIVPHLIVANISIVSWNIKDFGQSRNDAEITAIAQHIRHADVLAIQEVVAIHPGGAKAVARLADQLNRMGAKWDYMVSEPTQSTSSHRSERYAFLWKTSKLTVTGGGSRLLSELSPNVEREPYFIQFKSQNKVLTVINYHACTHKPDYPERGEINAISRWLMNKNYDNVIWAGDMNLNRKDIAFQNIIADGYTSVLDDEKTSLKMTCDDGDYLSKGEDNVLHKLSNLRFISCRVLDFMDGRDCNLVSEMRDSYSDHLPVEVELEL